MPAIDKIDIRRLDFTLLIVFELLLRRRNMTAVASEVGLTQSAVSHSVGRLRAIFDDPLFVRAGGGVEPTPRALLLGPLLHDALVAVRGAMEIGRSFDPATATRRFVVTAPDTIIAAMSRRVLYTLSHQAPNCNMVFRSNSHTKAVEDLLAGEIDLAIGVFASPPRETILTTLGQETFRVVARRDHPRFAGGPDLDTYCDLDHLVVSHDRAPFAQVDVVLASLGRQRRVAAVMPQMLVAFAAVSQSDAIITGPLSACLYAASVFPVTLHDPPLEIPGFALNMLRHQDGTNDPAITWLAGLLSGILRQTPDAQA